MRTIVPNRNYFKPIILKFKTFIYNSDSKTIYNFCTYGGNSLSIGEVTPPGETFFTVSIFRKDASKYAKLKVEPYICGNLKQIYQIFFFLIKIFLNLLRNVLANRLEGNRLISFVHYDCSLLVLKSLLFLKIKLL